MDYITADQIAAAIDYPGLVAHLEACHRAARPDMADLVQTRDRPDAAPDMFLNRAAWQHDEALGIKVCTVFPENLNRDAGLPSVQAVYLLFDGTDGRPLCAIDGTALTYWKTAADSALGTKLLARPDLETMLMVGAGALAPDMVRAHAAIRPGLRRILCWNRTAARARTLAERLAAEGLPTEPTDDLEAAARGADLISCATMATAPLIHGAWLQPGAHLDLVGAFTPELREADDEAIRRGRLFVDARETTLEKCGEVAIPLKTGVITEADVLGDYWDLCAGAPGRTGPDDITVLKNGGGGHLDLMTARHIAARVGAA